MKKIIAILSLCSILVCCEIKVEPRQASAGQITSYGDVRVHYSKYLVAGMEYGVFYESGFGNDHGGGVSVVNLTKDKLEIEKLNMEISNLKKLNK